MRRPIILILSVGIKQPIWLRIKLFQGLKLGIFQTFMALYKASLHKIGKYLNPSLKYNAVALQMD